MICVRCGRDSKYKDRSNRTCPGCKQKFAFEPRQGDPVTDMLFRKAINAVSSDGSVRWGVEHLYYEVCRRKRGNRAPRVVRSEEHTSELQSLTNLVCRLLLEKKKIMHAIRSNTSIDT